jgi:hypothetical protein
MRAGARHLQPRDLVGQTKLRAGHGRALSSMLGVSSQSDVNLDYSHRRATIGSTLAARRAGM